MRVVLAAAGLAAALAAAPARAGLTLEFESEGGVETLHIDGDRMRSDEPGGESTIFDGVAGKMIRLVHAGRSYTEMTPAQMKAAAAAMGAAMKEQLAALPPAERERAEAMMRDRPGAAAGQAKPPAVKWVRIGGTGSAAGVRCEWHRLSVQGQEDEEACLAPWGTLDVKKEDLRVFEKLDAFAREMAQAAGAAAGQGVGVLTQQVAAAPGFPIVSAKTADGRRTEERRLRAARRAAIPAERFTVPVGYARKEFGQGD